MTTWPAALAALLLHAAPPPLDEDLLAAERTLAEAKIPADGAALLRYFRDRTPTPAQRERLRGLVRQLGDEAFDVRQEATRALSAAGWPALGVLRAARRDPDLEVVLRAEICLRALVPQEEHARLTAAARVLAARKPAGGSSALLAFLPECLGEEDLLEELLKSLARLGRNDPALVAALVDPDPVRRGAAGFVLGQSGPAYRARVRKLLAASEPSVRFQAAHGLLLGCEREAIPALCTLVAGHDPNLVWRAEDLLSRVAGPAAPALPAGDDLESRRKRCAAWESWWMESGRDIDLARIEWQGTVYPGLTLVCDCDVGGRSQAGRVWACSRDGTVRWQVEGVANPADVQVLPGGRLLVAECHGGNKVTERDRSGKTLWEYKLSDSAVNCQRLPGGNTFMATYTELLEVTPAGKVVYSHRVPQRTTCALKLRNGNILYAANSGQVIEMTTAGKEVRSIACGNLGSWAGLEVLPGGRLLVAQYGADRVVEIDEAGKVQWSLEVQTPAWASRLRGGNTLVCSPDGHFIAEYDRAGKQVWKRESFGRPFRVRRD